MDSKKPKPAPLEPPSGATRGLVDVARTDSDAINRNLKSALSTADISEETTGRGPHHVRSFSSDRNKTANAPAATLKEGLKGGGNVESHFQGSTNQNSGLFIGGGKMAGANGNAYSPTCSPAAVKGDNIHISPHVVHVRSNSAGSIKVGKSVASGHWSAFEGASNAGSQIGGGSKGENISETLSNSGSSGGGSPSQDFGKGLRVAHVESGRGSNITKGLGNIGSRNVTNHSKSPSSGQATGRGSVPTPRNSGEFNILTNGNSGPNRGTSTPRHSGECNVSSNGAGSSSSSSPHTSGELGGAKSNLSSFSKLTLDSSNSSCIGGQPRTASMDGNISGGRVNLASNVGKGSKHISPGSPPMFNSAPATNPSLGNIWKGNWAAGGAKVSEKVDCTMGNILNPNYLSSPANGKIETMKSGVGGTRLANADSLSDGVLLKRGLSSLNAEEVKNLGNELYRKGSFADALSLYERAISLSPVQACYRSNKAAALSGLGRLPEAVHECEEAIKLDSLYARAHQRAGSLYLRLGLVESSKRHFQSAGQQNTVQELQQVEEVKTHISKCIEMRRIANWKLVLRDSDAAVAAGADSAPQVMGYKAEALFKLRKYDESDSVLSAAQRIDESLTRLGITPADSFLCVLRVNLDMALGRFEEAVAAAQVAVRIDSRKGDTLDVLRRARTVCLARSSGNELFKLGKFFEACAAYGEGLESDPSNAVLFCNRAACRSKIGQWEKAVEDCNAALELQPNYTKALLRRADSNAKLERWEDALIDYEALLKELPGDVDVAKGIFEAENALKRSRGEVIKATVTCDVEEVSDKDQFQEAVTFPGVPPIWPS